MDLLDYILIALAVLAALAATITVLISRRKMRNLVTEQSAQLALLKDEISGLAQRVEQAQTAPDPAAEALLITGVGTESAEPAISDRLVLSATVGEPLVKSLAFAHGLRVALSAESRNRIRFEMKREVRRARKQRRQDMKQAYRQMRQGDISESRTA